MSVRKSQLENDIHAQTVVDLLDERDGRATASAKKRLAGNTPEKLTETLKFFRKLNFDDLTLMKELFSDFTAAAEDGSASRKRRRRCGLADAGDAGDTSADDSDIFSESAHKYQTASMRVVPVHFDCSSAAGKKILAKMDVAKQTLHDAEVTICSRLHEHASSAFAAVAPSTASPTTDEADGGHVGTASLQDRLVTDLQAAVDRSVAALSDTSSVFASIFGTTSIRQAKGSMGATLSLSDGLFLPSYLFGATGSSAVGKDGRRSLTRALAWRVLSQAGVCVSRQAANILVVLSAALSIDISRAAQAAGDVDVERIVTAAMALDQTVSPETTHCRHEELVKMLKRAVPKLVLEQVNDALRTSDSVAEADKAEAEAAGDQAAGEEAGEVEGDLVVDAETTIDGAGLVADPDDEDVEEDAVAKTVLDSTDELSAPGESVSPVSRAFAALRAAIARAVAKSVIVSQLAKVLDLARQRAVLPTKTSSTSGRGGGRAAALPPVLAVALRALVVDGDRFARLVAGLVGIDSPARVAMRLLPRRLGDGIRRVALYHKRPLTSVSGTYSQRFVRFQPSFFLLGNSTSLEQASIVIDALPYRYAKLLAEPAQFIEMVVGKLAELENLTDPFLDYNGFLKDVGDAIIATAGSHTLTKGTVLFANRKTHAYLNVYRFRRLYVRSRAATKAELEGDPGGRKWRTILENGFADESKHFLLTGKDSEHGQRHAFHRFRSVHGTTSKAVEALMERLDAAELKTLFQHRLVLSCDPGEFNLLGCRLLDFGEALDGGPIKTLWQAFFRKRHYRHVTMHGTLARQSRRLAHGVGSRKDAEEQVKHRSIRYYRDKQYMAMVAAQIREQAKFRGKEVLIVCGTGGGRQNATSRSAALVDYLASEFLLMRSSEYGSSSFCPGCGKRFCDDKAKNDSFTHRSKECMTDGCAFKGRWNRDDIACLSIGIIWLCRRKPLDYKLPRHFEPPWERTKDS